LNTALNRVRGTDGVLWALPMYRGYLKVLLPDGTQKSVRVIGLDDATLMGGPPVMVQGNLADLRRDRGVLVNANQLSGDLMLSRLPNPRPLRVGDEITINDHTALVVGTYRPTPEFFWEPVFYTTFSRALTMAPSER
jgi:putative ABC transport system permease protein